jgi:dihydrofolate synthase/folylpolyglutamate synthase
MTRSARVYEAILARLNKLHPKLIDLALDRIERLLVDLGDPHKQLPPVVHIAGTNGKGSTLAYLRAMAEAAGLTVHVYTSPHLVRFNERIRIAGELIGDNELAVLLEEVERVNAGQPITFFEITNAAAFLAFARHKADLCLLETGLGGEFDSTNVIERPALTLLTTITFDHQAFLGDTIAQIAHAKAGIIKQGVPAIAAAQEPDAAAVFDARAAQLHAPLAIEGRDWRVRAMDSGMRVEFAGRALDLPRPNLPGAHQIVNGGLAVAAALALNQAGVLPKPLDDAAIAAGLQHADWPARLQRLTRGPLVAALPRGWELWLDGGHNPAGGVALAAMADAWAAEPGAPPLDMVVGMLDTKDARGFFAPFVGKLRRLRTVTIPNEVHSVTAEALAETARAAGLPAEPAPHLGAALAEFAGAAPSQDRGRVLICGSLYLAGVVLAENG